FNLNKYTWLFFLFTIACSSSRTVDPHVNQKITPACATKFYAGTDALIRIEYLNAANEKQLKEGILLPIDSSNVFKIMMTWNAGEQWIASVNIEQIEKIVLVKSKRSAVTIKEFNLSAQGKKAVVVYKNHKAFVVHELKLTGDTLSWKEGVTQRNLHISEIDHVTFTSHATGFLAGVLVGALGGGIFGFVTFTPPPDEDEIYIGPASSLDNGMIFGAVGLVIGGVVGAIIGKDTFYYFDDDLCSN
ncbi:hypothetical protein JNL27_12775, partial [bacterium]|nr:hypothetical protein [bacterium]